MSIGEILLSIYLGINVIGLIICLVGLEGGYVFWSGLFNPKVIYKSTKVNWFGAYFLASVAFICITPAALIFWFYKLCTVGRK